MGRGNTWSRMRSELSMQEGGEKNPVGGAKGTRGGRELLGKSCDPIQLGNTGGEKKNES